MLFVRLGSVMVGLYREYTSNWLHLLKCIRAIKIRAIVIELEFEYRNIKAKKTSDVI